MAEHEPHDPPFDEPALAEALSTQSAPVRDVAYGEGVQYTAAGGAAQLEIFPHTGVTRLTAPGVRIELFDTATLDVSDAGVEFSRTQPGQDTNLTIVRNGGIVFTLVAGGEYTQPAGTESLPQPAASDPTPALGGPETPQQAGTDNIELPAERLTVFRVSVRVLCASTLSLRGGGRKVWKEGAAEPLLPLGVAKSSSCDRSPAIG
jgi:hypothetical protein